MSIFMELVIFANKLHPNNDGIHCQHTGYTKYKEKFRNRKHMMS